MKINLGLDNTWLYQNCRIEEVAGRKNLVTPVKDAINTMGRNITDRFVYANPREEREEVTLTGPMAVWAYMVVFHAVVHRFKRVYYDDGKGVPVLIAAHG